MFQFNDLAFLGCSSNISITQSFSVTSVTQTKGVVTVMMSNMNMTLAVSMRQKSYERSHNPSHITQLKGHSPPSPPKYPCSMSIDHLHSLKCAWLLCTIHASCIQSSVLVCCLAAPCCFEMPQIVRQLDSTKLSQFVLSHRIKF